MSKLIPCKACGKEISKSAKACPQCGESVKRTGLLTKLIIWPFFAFVGLLILVGIFGDNSSTSSGSAASARATSPAAPAEPPLEVSSREIAHAYDSNEAAADAAYKGRTLRVTGVVTEITKDFADDTVVVLNGVNQFLGVHAGLEESEEQRAIQLRKGETVTLQCVGAGEVVSAPMLNKCRFQ